MFKLAPPTRISVFNGFILMEGSFGDDELLIITFCDQRLVVKKDRIKRTDNSLKFFIALFRYFSIKLRK